jgi:BTB/POZ domain-containing protein KCTD9
MEKELEKFITDAFAPYGDFPAREDVTRELLSNLQEKYQDLKAQGKSDQDAYQQTIDSFGDVTEIMDEYDAEPAEELTPVSTVHKLKGISLDEADLSKTNLNNANFSGSAIQRINFEGTDLTGAKFSGAAISDATFVNADLTDATFTASDLHGSSFHNAKINGTLFRASSLNKCNFEGATITDSLFKSSDFSKSSFNNSTITNTIFQSSSIDKSTFDGATLQNVSIRGNVKKVNFDGAKIDKVTYALLKGMKANLDNVEVI